MILLYYLINVLFRQEASNQEDTEKEKQWNVEKRMKEKQMQSSDFCLHNKQFWMMDKAEALATLNIF